jgi:hypothetical protein
LVGEKVREPLVWEEQDSRPRVRAWVEQEKPLAVMWPRVWAWLRPVARRSWVVSWLEQNRA